MRTILSVAVLTCGFLSVWVGCSNVPESLDVSAGTLDGNVRIDGSSTVYPITEAVAEEFRTVQPKVKVTVGISGTGGGMKKFTIGEIDICNASRGIKDKERAACAENGVELIELEVAFDGLAVVINPENDWCECMTVDQLKELWRPESAVKKWSDLNPDWPDVAINLYGPGTDSGTFDYFTEAIIGEEKASRADYTASEDDNVLVTGVLSDRHALAYFGYAYYAENKDNLKLLGVDGGDGCKTPSSETVRALTYQPLSRPLFIYVNKASLKRPEVLELVKFYLENSAQLSTDVGYVPVSDEVADQNKQRLQDALAAAPEAP